MQIKIITRCFFIDKIGKNALTFLFTWFFSKLKPNISIGNWRPTNGELRLETWLIWHLLKNMNAMPHPHSCPIEWNPGIFGWCFLIPCLQNWPINPNTFLPLRGNRILPLQIMPFLKKIIDYYKLNTFKKQKTQKSILPPLFLTKGIHIKTTTPCSRSVADLRNLGKSVKIPLCDPFLLGGLARIYLSKVFFSSTFPLRFKPLPVSRTPFP